MGATTLISVEEYLDTCYRPDCDYVEGRIVERNVGEQDHSDLQSEVVHWFRAHRKELNGVAYVEQRVQVAADRFRIPDVCFVLGPKRRTPIFTDPPFICIEVLSKRDTFDTTQDRIDDYLRFGVRNVWVIDPRRRRAWICTTQGNLEAKDLVLRTTDPEIVLPLAEIFAELDS